MPDFPGFRPRAQRADYVLTRAVLLRAIGFIYVVAFAILVRQVLPLIGEHGLLPVKPFLERVTEHFGSRATAVLRLPAVFWFADSDRALLVAAWLGLLLGALVLAGVANAPMLAVLWVLYLSFSHVGQVFYGYGWDSLLCETGLLAIFLAPALRPRLLSAADPPPFALIVLYRWLTFRLMFGAGLIKLRGDACWTDLTCLDFHYETQPNPSPLSWYFHFMPHWVHAGGVLFNHFAELVAPFGVFGPRRVRIAAGAVIVLFQTALILSGNLSFLNWLTIVIALACFDDHVFSRLASRRFVSRLVELRGRLAEPSRLRRAAVASVCLVVGVLSLNPVVNLLSTRQLMNASFDPLELVNTYGAFGSVERVRHEVVLEGTNDDPRAGAATFHAYEFPCKPGDPSRAPCLITPYHYRLDWQLWFAGLSNFRREPWLLHLAYLLLTGDPGVKVLLAKDPFPDKPPRFVRAQLYRYYFSSSRAEGTWWRRELEGEYLVPVSLEHREFRYFLSAYGWLNERRVKSH